MFMNIMNVLRTGMNMSISRIHTWLWYRNPSSIFRLGMVYTETLLYIILFSLCIDLFFLFI